MAEYANPDVLVSTEWVQENIGKDGIKIIESNEDILLYDIGHIEGAIKLDWETELQDKLVRDYIDKDNFEKLMSSKGISRDDTVIFYGDKSNWWACYALWTFKVYGHEKCLIMNEKCKSNKLIKWIELSSCQIYASQTRRPAKENNKTKPWTIHAKYKLLAEEALQKLNLPLIILRVANVYGKGDVRGVMPRIVTAAAYQVLGEPMNFLWGADLKINTVHVDDVVNAIW